MLGDRLNPKQTFAIFLGASWFTRAPKLAAGASFYKSAVDFFEYLVNPQGLQLPKENVLWLFDDSRSPGDQLNNMADFIRTKCSELRAAGLDAKDLFVYYVGHGLFTDNQDYCLAVRETNPDNVSISSIRANDLAGVVKKEARFLRRYLIFDCCFAASLYKEYQSAPLQAAHVKLMEELPHRGTALLCSSNAHDASLAPPKLPYTLFSGALLKALQKGHPLLGSHLSISELGDLVKDVLKTDHPSDWVRPEVLSPDQKEGDIADIPLFPNPAYKFQVSECEIAEQANQQQERAEKRQLVEQVRQEQERTEKERQLAERAQQQERAEKERQLVEQVQQEQERTEKERRLAERAQQQQYTSVENLDDAWESERKKREAELTNAVCEHWLNHGKVFQDNQEPAHIQKLKSDLDEWVLRCPTGFQNRQIEKQRETAAKTQAAMDSWLKRKKRN